MEYFFKHRKMILKFFETHKMIALVTEHLSYYYLADYEWLGQHLFINRIVQCVYIDIQKDHYLSSVKVFKGSK